MSKTREDWVTVWLESMEELECEPPSNYAKALIDFYSSAELRAMGIECGHGCMIHKQTIIVSPEKLKLGDNVRIDGFCTISAGAGITIGNNVHIAGYVSLFGGAGIEVGNNASIASGAKVYSVSDDVMGRGLVGPCAPLNKRHLHKGKVVLAEHSVLSVNTIVMPGGSLSKGSTLLPFSILVNEHPLPYAVLQGVPAKFIKPKRDRLQKLVEETE
jgi:acetyltransferase-like isoleucine patch superfamily enzyme